jgi:hypothetical protein
MPILKGTRPTFTISSPLVRVDIRGIPREYTDLERREAARSPDGPLPWLPDDQGLCANLLSYCYARGIYPELIARQGGGQLVAYFSAEHASLIRDYLAAQADARE